VSTTLLISAIGLLLVGAALFTALAVFPGLLLRFLGAVSWPILVSGVIILASQTVLPSVLAIISMQQRPFLYAAVRVAQAAIFAGGAFVAVMWLVPGGESVVHAKALAEALVLTFCIAWLVKQGLLVLRASAGEAWRCLAYSLPLVPQMFASAAIGSMDRIIVTQELDVAAAGIYSVGFQVGMIMWLVVNSTVQAWLPWFYRRMKEGSPEANRSIARVTWLTVVGWIVIGVVLWLMSPLMVSIVAGESFHDAELVAPWIIGAFLFQGLYSLVSAYLYYWGLTGRLAAAAVASAVMHITLTFLLVRENGIAGAGQAVLLAYAGLFVLVWLGMKANVRLPTRRDGGGDV
jgi:O-antigen/teichoic acid export membrane protein